MAEAIRNRIVKFAHKGSPSFQDVVKARVHQYFEDNNISTYSNSAMYTKTAAMLAMYFVPYALIASGVASTHLLLFYGMYLLMGLGIVGIGTCIMHDSNHGAYAHNKALNNFLGSLLNVLGGYSRNWKIQHNILHHTYTNIEGLDEDINAAFFLRMSPDKPLRKMHRYQYIYAWPLYCFMNLYWITAKDYVSLVRYDRNNLLHNQKITLRNAILELTAYKIIYIGYMIVIPILFAGVAWYHVLIGLLMMHFVAGFALAIIFQPAHVIGSSEYGSPSDERKMEKSWAVHQLLNTADFAQNNKLVSWFIGGLNFQIEHHLFPHICHIHYPRIARIVEEVAKDFGLPYHVMPTFRSAIAAHGRMLRKLGTNETL